jgi:hypothetical protein
VNAQQRIREVLDQPTASTRRAALADAVVELGPELLSALRSDSDPAAAGLAPQAQDLLSSWLVGERITARADEPERRVRVARALATPDDPVLARIAAVAILRLPEGHPERDLEYARTLLCDQLARTQQAGLCNEQLMAGYYLVKYGLLSPDDALELIAALLPLLARGVNVKAARDFLEGAHDFCLVQAGRELEAGDRGENATWMKIGRGILDVALQRAGDDDQRTIGMAARHHDLADEPGEAAAAYARFVDLGDPSTRMIQTAALSEATARLKIDDADGVIARLGPMLSRFGDRYLTAVTSFDVADAGFAFGRAATLLASAQHRLGDHAAAIRTADGAKSLRLRYRAALAQHPARDEMLRLERQVRAAARAGDVDTESGLPEQTLLLESYRRVRPELPPETLDSPAPAAIARVLAPDEIALLLTLADDATFVAAIGPGEPALRSARRLPEWSWWRWQELLEAGGWIEAVGGHGDDGPAALARLLDLVDRGLGEVLVDLAGTARRVSVVPHRWLHLVPFDALPSLARFSVTAYASAAELVAERSQHATDLGDAACVAISNPGGDLNLSASETESFARRQPGPVEIVERGAATAERVAQALASASVLHFSGHGVSDPADLDRCALLVARGQLSAGDLLVSGDRLTCRLVFLSACESGVVSAPKDIDEYGGLPVALRLAGAQHVVCTRWIVSEGLAALYVDRFYERWCAGPTDPAAVVREIASWLREVGTQEVLERLGELARAVHPRSPLASFGLEAYASEIAAAGVDRPFAHPWNWAAFYVVGLE